MTAKIKIDINAPFGPFSELRETTLPQFTVILGENGSGKTQLLSAIWNGSVSMTVNGATIPPRSPVLLSGALSAEVDLSFKYEGAHSAEKTAIQQLQQFKHNKRIEQEGPNRMRARTTEPSALLTYASDVFNKRPQDLLEEEVEIIALQFHSTQGNYDIRRPKLAMTSMAYLRQQHLARRAQATIDIGDGDDSLAGVAGLLRDQAHNPPPWVLASAVLQPFGFTLTGPTISAESAQNDLSLSLLDESGNPTDPRYLSGGERCLVALALAQYMGRTSRGFPSAMLLDECLAPLHPSIINKAITVLDEVFSQERNIPIVITTHSPTMVALAKEDTLFLAERKDAELHLKKVSSDEAIGHLTTAIPTMRFDPENRRQVFVEAQQDEFVYTRLYQALRNHLSPEVALEFIPAGRKKGEGSCDTVDYLVKTLTEKGISTARGVIDWDNSRKPESYSENVSLFSPNKRYALETAILDPLIICLTLGSSERGRSHVQNHTTEELRKLTHHELQPIVDSVCLEIKRYAQGQGKKVDTWSNDSITVEYLGGLKLQIPRWVLFTKGHDYAGWVIETFRELKTRRAGPNNEPSDKLVASIAADNCRDWAAFLPAEIVELFRSLCK